MKRFVLFFACTVPRRRLVRASRATRLAAALALGLVSAAHLIMPAGCAAEDSRGAGPALVSYGLSGFWLGAEDGLAAGYLSTGSHFEDHEWRNLVVGAGIGALVGAGSGLLLGDVDASSETRPGIGWYVLRDGGYGATLGALVGLAVGAIILAGSGEPKILLVGASIGTLAGTGLGLVLGAVEGAGARRRSRAAGSSLRLAFTVLPARDSGRPTLVPGVRGSFGGI